MPKLAQIAFSGPSGATDLAVTLAMAGKKANVEQTLAFWGNEPAPTDRLRRCAEARLETTVFQKKTGSDWKAQSSVCDWAASRQDAAAFIVHYPAALIAIRKVFKSPRRPRRILVEHNSNALKRPHHWVLSALAFWLCDGIVYLTEEYRDQVRRKLGPLFRAGKTTVIANGLDLDRYANTATRSTAKAFTIGMSGRMVAGKDFSTLLEAFALMRAEFADHALHLELAGDGPHRPALEQKAAELGLTQSVTFTGNLPHAELIRRMWTWDAFALSTLGETQSLALMEAMACGLPTVATAVNGVREMVENGKTALLVPAGDAAAMARSLGSLIQRPEQAKSLGDEAKAAAQLKFSSARMFSNYYDFIGCI